MPPAAMKPDGMMSTGEYRAWSVADEYAHLVDSRWEELKEHGNEELKLKDFQAAIDYYTSAYSICDDDGTGRVGAFFEALNTHLEDSVAHGILGARQDIEPILQQLIRTPCFEDGEPNKPAAICLSNRAAAHLKLGNTLKAVQDAHKAVTLCPEYTKAMHRHKQALIADGQDDVAGYMARQIGLLDRMARKDTRREKPERDLPNAGEGEASGIWLGFRLVFTGFLSGDKYVKTYEEMRAEHWRSRAVVSAKGAKGVRIHMVCFPIGTKCMKAYDPDAGPTDETWLALHLTVCPSRPSHLGEVEPLAQEVLAGTLLQSIDYRYLRFVGNVKAVTPQVAARLADVVESELPMLTSLSLCPSLAAAANELRATLDARGQYSPGRLADVPPDLDAGLDMCYVAGEVLKHRKFGYRGVIARPADHTCMMDERWIEQMGVDELPRGRYQPWYHVLVDTRDRPGEPQSCYVCHDNIILWPNPPHEEPSGPIRHPELRQIFKGYNIERGRYVAQPMYGRPVQEMYL